MSSSPFDENTDPNLPRTAAVPPRPRPSVPRLVQLAAEARDDVGRVLELREDVAVLGRASQATLVLNDGGASRRHASIQRHGDEWRVVDLESRNGTFVNDVRVTSAVLRDGDRLRIGTSSILRFTTSPASDWLPSLEGARASWDYALAARELSWSEESDHALGLPAGTLSNSRGALTGLIGREDESRVQAAITLAVNGGESFDLELKLQLGPHTRWVRMHGHVLRNAAGRPDRLTGTATDITERKKRDLELGRMALMFECLSDGVFFTDPALKVVDSNSAARTMFRITREEALGGMLFDVLATPAPAALETQARVALREQGRWVIELQIPATGREQSFEVVAFPLRSDDAVVGVAFLFRDVTERKRLQTQLAFYDRLSSLGTMSAGIAHEINNPLTFVLTSIEYVMLSLTGEDQPDLTPVGRLTEQVAALQDARDGAHRIAGIVRDLKAFSRDDVSPTPVPTNVNRSLELAMKMTNKVLTSHAELATFVAADLPLARATETRLSQVFTNLLMNAAQAIPEGRAGRITVRARHEKGQVVVEISDDGVGIPAAQLPRIFDPFFTTKPVGQGTGLGLSICHGLVQGFGGSLTVDSVEGKGSTFSVRLKAAEGVPAPEPKPPAVARRQARVLVVDDEPLILRSFLRVLGQHEVVTCSTVDEALQTIARRDFDVILCDITMPERSGMDLYDDLLRTRPELAQRMAFFTGGAFTPKATRFLATVPNRTLAKPVDHAELTKLIEELMGRAP
ncbi:MAG: PAS domain-containing protein [Archangiaceae bacterium]|nr:PAS domain-containing protein [Archangiaceae bacterium]